MYNSEQKARFILEYSKSVSTNRMATAVFNITEKYENEWGADICTKTADELRPVLEKMAPVRVGNGWSSLYILQQYVKWCIKHNVPGAVDGLSNIQIDGLENVRSRMVSGPLHLQRCLDEVFEPETEETIDVTYRTFFWFAFAGINEQEIFSVTAEDVDVASLSIVLNGVSYPLYREALPAVLAASKLSEFVYKHPGYRKNILRQRIPGGELLRGVKGNKTEKSSLRVTISSRVKKAIDNGSARTYLAYSRVYLSGLFYRMYERERAGYPVDFSEDATRFVGGRSFSYISTDGKINEVKKGYEKDYQRWKTTFMMP